MPCLCLLRLFVVSRHLRDVATWGLARCFLMDRFSCRLPSSRSTPSSVPRREFWSDGLPAGILLNSPTVRALTGLRTTFFKVAVTSGLRSSQHLEKLRHPSGLVVSAVGLRELLAKSPRCWAKIEQLSLSLSLPPRFQLGCSLVHIDLPALWVSSGWVSGVRLVVPFLNSSSGL